MTRISDHPPDPLACLVGVSRGRRGEWCDLGRRWASFCVAGAGNHAQQLKLLDFVALCEKSAVCVRVDVLGVPKSWQAQGIQDLYGILGSIVVYDVRI